MTALAAAEVTTRTIRDRIREELEFDPNASDTRTAQRIMLSVTKDDLLPLLIEEVSAVRRESARREERSVIPRLLAAVTPHARAGRKPKPVTAKERQDALLKLRPDLFRLRNQQLDLGDGVSVRWGSANVAQLRQRLDMLKRQAAGITASIGQLSDVIVTLEQAGVDCLDDLVTKA